MSELTGQASSNIAGISDRELNVRKTVSEIYLQVEQDKAEDILTYRDRQFKNAYTGRVADKNQTRWLDDRDP